MKNLSRGKRMGSAQVDMASVHEAISRMDDREHVYVGIVVKRQGESSHFEVITDDEGNNVDVHVEVDLMPEEMPVTCRLSCGSSTGGGDGLWKVPAEGAEVVVVVPGGTIEDGPTIVAVLSTGAVPDELDETALVLKNRSGDVKVVAAGSSITIRKDGDID